MPLQRYSILTAAFLALAVPAWPQNVTCSSDDGNRHYCEADTRRGVQMVRQRSGSPCTQGYSWDYDGRGIWVDHGCRADFVLQAGPAEDYRSEGKTVTCSSDDGGRHYCNAETRAGVRMIRQRSGSPCEKDYSWGFDDRGIWVDHGCRADFALETGPPGYNPDRNRTPGDVPLVTCSSDDERRHYCTADTRRGVRLVRQISGSACQQGYSWDYDGQGIWVDHGCRAEFALEIGRQPDNPFRNNSASGGKTVTCSSDDGRRHYCTAETRAGVQMIRQHSGSPCEKDYSWGFDDRGIWVDHGCRADFALETGPAPEAPCIQTAGAREANRLAEQCTQVSPATHPPCNVQNSCSLIIDEIRRSCSLLRGNAPAFCRDYR